MNDPFFFIDRQKDLCISALLTEFCMPACLYVTHINIITLIKQPGAAQQPLKRKLLERGKMRQTFSYFKVEENIENSDVVGNICPF